MARNGRLQWRQTDKGKHGARNGDGTRAKRTKNTHTPKTHNWIYCTPRKCNKILPICLFSTTHTLCYTIVVMLVDKWCRIIDFSCSSCAFFMLAVVPTCAAAFLLSFNRIFVQVYSAIPSESQLRCLMSQPAVGHSQRVHAPTETTEYAKGVELWFGIVEREVRRPGYGGGVGRMHKILMRRLGVKANALILWNCFDFARPRSNRAEAWANNGKTSIKHTVAVYWRTCSVSH